MGQRLRHDTAHALAVALLEIVENCIRPEDRLDALQEFYQAAMAGLEAYDTMREREARRLNPSRN